MDNRTSYQDTAICSTIVPNRYKMIHKTTNEMEKVMAKRINNSRKIHMEKRTLYGIFFLCRIICSNIAAPIVVIYNLGYVPIVHNVFQQHF